MLSFMMMNSMVKMLENMNGKQVVQGQYVVSDTRCPALSDCELSEGKQGSGPEGDEVL